MRAAEQAVSWVAPRAGGQHWVIVNVWWRRRLRGGRGRSGECLSRARLDF